MKRVKLSNITGSLSEYASLSTNPKFIEIIERSRANALEQGAIPLAGVRRKYGLKGRTSGRRRAR